MKHRKLSKNLERKLDAGIRVSRRNTVYKFIMKENDGECPCFVCGKHVKERTATLEHILPHSLGGGEEMDNLSISHIQCNKARGSDIGFTRKIIEWTIQDLDDRIVSFRVIS